ncbi:integrase [Streptomyces sp. NPDC048518]|uniref:integrase n=1 Tax=Streptomyces sp. NPDC048518 TaxID=3155029 RepID=UPI0033C88E72
MTGELSGVDPAEGARRAGQSIQVLFRYYAKFLAEARNHANSLIEDSMRRWEGQGRGVEST